MCTGYKSYKHYSTARTASACAAKCTAQAGCDHIAAGTTCYTYVGCVKSYPRNHPSLTYYRRAPPTTPPPTTPPPTSSPPTKKRKWGFNGIVLKLTESGKFIDEKQCEDYNHFDIATNKNTSRTTCEKASLYHGHWSKDCTHGKGALICTPPHGSTPKCVSCPPGYAPTRYFDKDFLVNPIAGTSPPRPKAHCPDTRGNGHGTLECSPLDQRWFTSWGDNPLKRAEIQQLAVQNTFQCAPWGDPNADKRHCLNAGVKFTRYNDLTRKTAYGPCFWLVYCNFVKHAYCKKVHATTDSGNKMVQSVCANKKTIAFNKAGLKCSYSGDVVRWFKDEAEIMEIPEGSEGYILRQAHDSELGGNGICSPVAILA